MTCQELRRLFEDPLRVDAPFRAGTEHLAHCAGCARFVEARRELAAGLRLVRESIPQLPGSMDSTVLAHYRRHISDRPLPVSSTPTPPGSALVPWSAAATVILLMATLLFVSGRTTDIDVVRLQSRAQPSSTPQSVTPITTASQARMAKPIGSHSARRRSPVPSNAQLARPALQGFRGLMHCDELSCGGVMQLVRVQLQSSFTAFAPASAATSRPVLADVLVGPDGIARGIRIVE